jgi:hypothetical protein
MYYKASFEGAEEVTTFDISINNSIDTGIASQKQYEKIRTHLDAFGTYFDININ